MNILIAVLISLGLLFLFISAVVLFNKKWRILFFKLIKDSGKFPEEPGHRPNCVITDSHAVLKDLIGAEQLFRILVENAPMVFFVVDEQGVFLLSEGSGLKRLGLNPGQLVGRSLFDVYRDHPDINEAVRTALSGKEIRCEFNLQDMVFDTFIAPVCDQCGRISGAVGIANDISTSRGTEEALRQSEELHRKFMRTVPDLVVRTDIDGTITFLNERGLSFFQGISREQVLGRNMLSFIAEEDLPRAMQNTRLMFEKPLGPKEYRINLGEDRFVQVEVNGDLIRDREGNPAGMIYVIRDVSERKQALDVLSQSEAALKRQHELLSALLENLPIGVFMVEAPDGKPLIANKAARRMLGQGLVPDAIGESLAEVYQARKLGSEGHYPARELPVIRAMQGESAYVDDMIVERPDGSEILLEVFGTPVRDEQGRIWGGLISFRDISAIKSSEAEKEKLQAQLAQAQKLESIGRLAGGVAHDFNNMLAVILGRTEIVLSRLKAEPELEEDLQSIRRAARRSAEVVRQLLAFARKQTIKPCTIDLNAIVSDMLGILQRLIGENIELVWQPGQELWPVRADKNQLEQVLLNLCVNARDAISHQGRIVIETFNRNFDQADSKINPDCSPGEFACLQVSDNGCGMDDEVKAHVFEPFFTTKAPGRGTGLGMASIYGAVRQNLGFINVVSEPGRGTSIQVHIPRDWSAVPQAHAEEKAMTPPTGRETILLVEDEEEVMEVVRQQLLFLGYRVLSAACPARALELAVEYRSEIDLLLSDVVMPEMNGRQLGEKILEIDPAVRLLFMSGYTTEVIAHHGMLDQGVNFIQKPFSIKELAAQLRQILDGKKTSRGQDKKERRRGANDKN